LQIIDEVSMVSSAMLTMIHLRLNDIFRISADSGNITQLHSKCFQLMNENLQILSLAGFTFCSPVICFSFRQSTQDFPL
jgi:hypothetical protein